MSGVLQQLIMISVQASFLIVAVLLCRMMFKKASANFFCVLWILVGIRLMIPLQIQAPFSLVPDMRMSAEQLAKPKLLDMADIQGMITDESFFLSMDGENSDLLMAGNGMVVEQTSGEKEGVEVTTANVSEKSSKSVGGKFETVDIEAFAMAIWMVGAMVMLVYMLVGWLRLKMRLKTAVPQMITYSGRQVKVYCADGISTPFLLGMLQPKIYMPYNLQEENLEYILAHEQMHIRRKDYLTKPLAFMVLAVYWFHPLVWVAYILFGRDVERACDEQVLRQNTEMDKAAYAGALLSCASGWGKREVCPVAFGESDVKKRVKNVLNYNRPGMWVGLTGVLTCVVFVMCFMTVRGAEGKVGSSVVDSVKSANEELARSAEVNESSLLTMEQLLEWKSTGELQTMAKEQGLEAFLAFDNVYRMECGNVLKEKYGCALEFEGEEYEMVLTYFLPRQSAPGEIYSIAVRCEDSGMSCRIYCATGLEKNSPLPILYMAYELEHYISYDVPEGYRLGEFNNQLDFAGCLLEGGKEPQLISMTREPQNRYAAGGLGIFENDLRLGHLLFENGKVCDVTWEEGNVTRISDVETVEGCVYSAVLTEYRFKMAKGATTYWYVFICDEDNEIGYVVYLNQECFSKDDAIALARSIQPKE